MSTNQKDWIYFVNIKFHIISKKGLSAMYHTSFIKPIFLYIGWEKYESFYRNWNEGRRKSNGWKSNGCSYESSQKKFLSRSKHECRDYTSVVWNLQRRMQLCYYHHDEIWLRALVPSLHEYWSVVTDILVETKQTMPYCYIGVGFYD